MNWPLPADGDAGPGMSDPYLIWAAATNGAYLANRGTERLRLALRLRDPATLAALLKIDGLTVPAIYRDRSIDATAALRSDAFCTAEITADSPAADWQRLHELADVLLAEPGMARPDAPPQSLDRLRETQPNSATAPSRPAKVVIGVIDGACGFAHRHFRRRQENAWTSRLLAFWDQQGDADADLPARAVWQRPVEFGHGRELRIDDFDALLNRHLGTAADDDESQAFGERAIYRALGVGLPAVSDWSHGTHVLDMAGGSPPLEQPAPLRSNIAGGDAPLQAVAASDVDAAGLVFVQLPEVALRDTSGRWIAALVLDGIRYILARAGAEARVVINLSLAAFAGPHDGSSMIEQAIDALIDEHPDRLNVVVAAGNAGKPRDDGDGGVRRCHAEVCLQPAGGNDATCSLEVEIDRADASETFIELWLPDEASGYGVTVELLPPRNAHVICAAPGEQKAWRPDSGAPALAMVVNLSNRSGPGPRGNGPMVLLAIGTTRNVTGFKAPVGIWQIRVTHHGHSPVLLQAWIERRDIPGELAGERPQYGFVGNATAGSSSTANTLGSLANGRNTIVVGAAEYPQDGERRIADISSRRAEMPAQGVAARPISDRPQFFAPGEFAAAGFLSGSRKTLKGTSMAAAWVTRLVASRLLADGTSQKGVRAWLQSLGTPVHQAGAGRSGPHGTGAAAAIATAGYSAVILPPTQQAENDAGPAPHRLAAIQASTCESSTSSGIGP
ncbi:S8 family serine peptidase [Piscinibacter sakaiensis]|uniref:S8 family serine peptidase n=1 Tax=Piscinibacter sakaiensis TaxID=1547922 RepID=UPI003AAA7AFA